MTPFQTIILVVWTTSVMGLLVLWAFWTVPWIRSHGAQTAPLHAWILGYALWYDLLTARAIAKNSRAYPLFLHLQMGFALTFLVILCLLILGLL